MVRRHFSFEQGLACPDHYEDNIEAAVPRAVIISQLFSSLFASVFLDLSDVKGHRLFTKAINMSGAKIPGPESSEIVNVHPKLLPGSQKDLDDALDEPVAEEDAKKKTWVNETRSALYRAFATGRKAETSPHDSSLDLFSAKESTENDLRHVLVGILILARCSLLELI